MEDGITNDEMRKALRQKAQAEMNRSVKDILYLAWSSVMKEFRALKTVVDLNDQPKKKTRKATL
jgi:hypothetical protein